MGLLSESIYWVAAALGVVAVTGGAWLTSRTPRGRFSGWVLNMLVIVLSSALVAVSAFLVLNRQNSWYASLSEIWAKPGVSITVQHGSRDPQETFGKDPAVDRTDKRALPPLPSPGERVQVFEVPSSVGPESWQVTVVLPADYFDPQSADRAYPVLVGGHGIPGHPSQFRTKMDLETLGDQSVSLGAVHPFVAVLPELLPDGVDTECIFGPSGPDQMETWLTVDAPRFVKEHLRVIQGRTGWAWIGISAGAFCGVMSTMRHPETFAAAISLGGYFKPIWDGTPPLARKQQAEYDLPALARNSPPPVALYLQSSKQDKKYWKQTTKFLSAVRAPTLVESVEDDVGGHNWNTWLPHFPDAMEWLGRTVPGFKP